MLTLALAACQNASDDAAVPGDSSDTQPFDRIAGGDIIHLTGTEPFWGGEVHGDTLTYETPSDLAGEGIDSVTAPVERFAGRAGLSFTGTLAGTPLILMVSDGACSDGMSDRRYPFTATLKLGEEVREGCAWTDEHKFEGPERP